MFLRSCAMVFLHSFYFSCCPAGNSFWASVWMQSDFCLAYFYLTLILGHITHTHTQKITLAKKTQTVSQNILAFVFCVIVSIMFNISTISSIQGGTVVQRLALLSHTAGSVWVGQGRVGGVPMFLQCPYRSCLGAPASSHSGDFKWVVGVNGLSVTHSPGVHQLATSLKWKDGFHPYCHGQKFTSPGGNLLHVLLWDL